jgi:hypothetical protein
MAPNCKDAGWSAASAKFMLFQVTTTCRLGAVPTTL